jgi:DNA polymerase III alpha subunit
LGLYLSQHPLQVFELYLSEKTLPIKELRPEHDGKSVAIGGAIGDVREIVTKNGKKMAFVKLEDLFGEIEVVVFPGPYQETSGIWERDKVVLVRGKVSSRGRDGSPSDELKVLVDDAREITVEQATGYQETGKKVKAPKPGVKKVAAAVAPTTAKTAPPKVYIRLENSSDQAKLISLKETIDANHGDTEVVLVLGATTSRQVIKLPGGVNRGSDAIVRLAELVGADNLKVK